MRWKETQINDVYDRTRGRCHICHRRLSFHNYGAPGARGAWEVDHSVPRARGGTHRRNNLYAACIYCNRSKRHCSTKVVRYGAGTRRAPLCHEKWINAKRENAAAGGLLGAFVGWVMVVLAGAEIGAGTDQIVLASVGAVTGGVFFARIAYRQNPDRK